MADMEPVNEPQAVQYLTTPAFSSPDPATEGLRMIPVNDDEGHATWEDPAEAEELKAADWVTEINNASDQEGLDSVLEAFAATGKDYKTVTEAAEKKQADLDAS